MVNAKKVRKDALDAKKAVKTASDYLRFMLESEGISDIRLEGLQFKENRPKRWFVTLSYSRFPERIYKRVDVDAQTGEVKAMRPVVL